MRVAEQDIKQRVVQELEKLPPEKLGEVLDFVTFLSRHPTRDETYIPVRFLPASSLDGLMSLVEWGGDAVANSDASMMETPEVVIDTSVLGGLIDREDTWHDAGGALRNALKASQVRLVYFDCVVNEAISVLARRAKERKHVDEFPDLLERLSLQVPQESITWISVAIKRLYAQIMDLVRDTSGELNFHDALIASGCRDLGIKWVATFDSDFDKIKWLKRLWNPEGVKEAFQQGAREKN